MMKVNKTAITVVKVGGAVVEDATALSRLLTDFAAIPGRKILVHGGGRRATKVAEALQAIGVNAIGLTGADANIIRAHKRPVKDGVDYGFVGDVDAADGQMIARLVESGVTPVVAPLTHDGQGHILNTNADTIAKTVACAVARD